MKNKARPSTIALLAAGLAVSPAAALSLNLGGDGPLVDLGNDNNANATVSIDTGGTGGGGGDAGLLNLGGGGNLLDLGGTGGGGTLIDLSGDDGTDAAVEIDLGTTGAIGGSGNLLDFGPDGLLDLGGEGTLIDLGDGLLLDLSGNDDSNAAVEIDLGETGGIGDSGLAAGRLLDLGDDDGVELNDDGNLFRPGTDATADLGDTSALADVNLDGGDEPLLDLDLFSGERGAARTGLLSNTIGNVTLGGDNVATIALNGSGDDSAGGGTGGSGDVGDGGGAGDNGGSGGNGGSSDGSGDGGTGTTGDAEDDPGIDDVATGAIGTAPRGAATGARAGASGGRSSCLSLTGQDINYLVERHDYDWPTFSTWADATAMNVVEVDICDDVEANILLAVEASANVDRLQDFLAAQAKVRLGLQQTGHTTEDVIAADGAGETLVVYVIKG